MGYRSKNSLIVSSATRSASIWHNNTLTHNAGAARTIQQSKKLFFWASSRNQTCASLRVREHSPRALKDLFFSPTHTALCWSARGSEFESCTPTEPAAIVISVWFINIFGRGNSLGRTHVKPKRRVGVFVFWKKCRRHSTRPLFPVPRMCCIFFHQIHILPQMRVDTNSLINYS